MFFFLKSTFPGTQTCIDCLSVPGPLPGIFISVLSFELRTTLCPSYRKETNSSGQRLPQSHTVHVLSASDRWTGLRLGCDFILMQGVKQNG